MAVLPDDTVLGQVEARLMDLWQEAKDANNSTRHTQRMEPELLQARLTLELIRTLRSLFEKLDEIDQTLQP